LPLQYQRPKAAKSQPPGWPSCMFLRLPSPVSRPAQRASSRWRSKRQPICRKMPAMNKAPVNYLSSYSSNLQQQAQALLDAGKTAGLLLKKYPQAHSLNSERALYDFAMALKNSHLRSSPPISKVIYDDKIHVINNALGLHTFVSRVQGGKLKAKKEI